MTDENPTNKQLDEETTNILSNGLLSLYQPKLTSVRGQLLELTKKQQLLCKELHAENLKFSEAQCSADLQEMFTKIRIYKEKLSNVKKNMNLLHEQSTKLKKKALKLEQQKQKEALEKVQQRDYEEQLIGKPSTS